MPRFETFRGLRYAAGPDLTNLVCPPYDVIDGAERDRLASQDPRNAVHIELPTGGNGYANAADTFARWRSDRDVVEDEPSLYAYRMTPPESAATLGYLGALGVTDGDGLLPHERTTPKARSDRLELLTATRINTSPIWALSLAEGLSRIYEPDGEPLAFAIDKDDVRHEVWRVPTDPAQSIAAAVVGAPAAVADGHHRWETTRNYLAGHPEDAGADRILALVVELSPAQLEVRPIHRLIGSVPSGTDLRASLAPWFETVPPSEAEVTLVTRDGEILLRALPSTRRAAAHDADSERMQVALDALGIDDVTYPHDEQVVRDAVRTGDSVGGLLLRPVEVDVISAAARAGERFPPKTTFFWPKPLTGFVYRSLDG